MLKTTHKDSFNGSEWAVRTGATFADVAEEAAKRVSRGWRVLSVRPNGVHVVRVVYGTTFHIRLKAGEGGF